MLLKNLMNKKRMVVLDIETTGLNRSGLIYKGHRIIEIGAIEIINRVMTGNNFHTYINPKRLINHEAFLIHGISNHFLSDKPFFFEIFKDFKKYIGNSNIIVHNANFDIKFLEYQIKKINRKEIKISKNNKIIDTLSIAQSLFPGKKNNLDALCNRYHISILNRKMHSALLDAQLLAEVYLRMTSFQKEIIFKSNFDCKKKYYNELSFRKEKLIILKASKIEQEEHLNYLKRMEKSYSCLWNKEE